MSAVAAYIAYREVLPSQCPPSDAGALNAQTLLRLVENDPVVEGDFDSHASLGYDCPSGADKCSFASCSLFLTSVSQAQLRKLTKYKRLKKKTKVAYLSVDSASGVGKIAPSKHVDFWIYQGFSPSQNVTQVVELDDYEAA